MADVLIVPIPVLNEGTKCSNSDCNGKVVRGVVCLLCGSAYDFKCASLESSLTIDETQPSSLWICKSCIPNPDVAKKVIDMFKISHVIKNENNLYKKLVYELEEKVELLRNKTNTANCNKRTDRLVMAETANDKTDNNGSHQNRKQEPLEKHNIQDNTTIMGHAGANEAALPEITNGDKEFSEYEAEFNLHWGRIVYKKVKEIVNDLFKMPDYSLAHCVAEDFTMGSGIALSFRQRFGQVPLLLNQRESTGGCAILQDRDRFIYYLITKRWAYDKPTYNTLFSSLRHLRAHVNQHNVGKLAMPRIGSGANRLEWDNVKFMLEFVFKKTDIEITICNPDPTEDASKSLQKHKNCKVTNVTYPIQDVGEGTIILYFSSEDGHVSEEMKQLDKKFHFLSEFNQARKRSGNVILHSKNSRYLVCGCIVKRSQRDPFDFSSLANGLANIQNKKYRFCAYQAIRDSDCYINYKITNILRNNLRDLEVYVCWPGDLKDLMSPRDKKF